MNRLDSELRRLFAMPSASPVAAPAGASAAEASGQTGHTRALRLSVSRPQTWDGLGRVWRGVQTDLDLPAPVIGVTGDDACALWFSLAQPVAGVEADAFLCALQRRYLADLAPQRIRLDAFAVTSFPGDAASADAQALPPREIAPGRWSAFVAPDLAALFDDEPWLDLPPPVEAQADLLSRVQCIRVDDWRRALERLGVESPGALLQSAAVPPGGAAAPTPSLSPTQDPRSFLLQVMNDPGVDLHLRIEAAKALLPGADTPQT